MKSNQNDHSRSPEYPGQAIKSQKNITTAVAFHLKTEHNRDVEQHHRSPEARLDLRQGARRPQLPSKLLEVFNQQKQNKKYGGKVAQPAYHNIDKLVQNSEYKETQKYLEPLKLKEERKEATERNENRNLFNPVKKMMKIVNKFTQEIRQVQDISVDRLRTGPKISECITLEVAKRGHNTGIIKKMLHIPTLTLVCVREEPITHKQSRNFIRDWTNLWRDKLSGQSKHFVTIHDVLYNYPEGAISIFMEYFKSRSLLNLLDVTTTLPESVIREILMQLTKTIETFYSMTNLHFGGLSPSQIMFTEDNRIKLSLGLFYHIPNLQAYSLYHIKSMQKSNPFDFSSTVTKFMKTSIEKPLNVQMQRSIDVFKIGLIALNCAIGNFENFEQSGIIIEAVRYLFTEQGQKQVDFDNVCCIVHSQHYLLENAPSNQESEKTNKKTQQKFIDYMKLLKDRFSTHFINFLCMCLKLSHSKRATLGEAISSTFIAAPHDNENKTVKIQLADLLVLVRGWNQDLEESATLLKLENFIGLMKPVLEYCNKDSLTQLVTANRDRVYEVGKEIGFNSKLLGQRMEDTILEILRSKNKQ